MAPLLGISAVILIYHCESSRGVTVVISLMRLLGAILRTAKLGFVVPFTSLPSVMARGVCHAPLRLAYNAKVTRIHGAPGTRQCLEKCPLSSFSMTTWNKKTKQWKGKKTVIKIFRW